jgi:hypothetical protein
MTDMIAAEPALARRILGRLAGAGSGATRLADAIRATLAAGEPVVVTGCGTSEHGALAVVEVVREAARAAGLPGAAVTSEQAFELSLAPPVSGLLIGISHGGTAMTALRAARDAAGRPRSSRSAADLRRRPGRYRGRNRRARSGWCHTVGYLSPILGPRRWVPTCRSRSTSGRRRPVGRGRSDEPCAERIAAVLADAAQPVIASVRPPGWARIDAQGRGGVAMPGLPRSRDVPSRASARHWPRNALSCS